MEKLTTYYFPITFLLPSENLQKSDCFSFGIARREWNTSLFDLATLATKHKLHLPYQIMDVMLKRCNLEIWIKGVSYEAAVNKLSALLLCLYIEGVSPTFSPFVSTHSINDYSGINERENEYATKEARAKLRQGVTLETGVVECWPVSLSFYCHSIHGAFSVSHEQFLNAAQKASKWLELEVKKPALRVVREAAQAAPLLISRDQSLLHIWCALESLFPQVNSEVNFRLGLYLAQLGMHTQDRTLLFKRTKAAYNVRSKVAHGSIQNIKQDQWRESWDLLLLAANAILVRGGLPDEDVLLTELLATNDSME